MIESLGLTGEGAIPLLAGLLLVWGLVRIVNNPDNPIDWWHFVASYNERVGKEYGDINSLGMMAGIVGALFAIVWEVYKTNGINPWTLGVCLVYLGGVKAFATWLRMVAAKRYAGTTEADSAGSSAARSDAHDQRQDDHAATTTPRASNQP